MKIFVTGGAGFIGSNYVRHVLAHTDDEVTVYDSLTYAGNLSTLRDVDDDPRYSFVKGNICDTPTLEEAMAGHDAVVHFAAESHVDRSIVGPDDFINTNCFGTNVIMDTARRLDIERVVHIGTDEVYGSVEVGSSKETDPLEPRSPYSASKAGSDLIALSYHHTYGAAGHRHPLHQQLRAVPVPGEGHPAVHHQPARGGPDPALRRRPQRARLALRRRPLRRRPAGARAGRRRARSTTSAPATRPPTGCSSTSCSALLGVGEELVSYVEDRLGHDRRYSVDITKVTELGWRKQRTLDEALEETVAWYRDNDWWWRPLQGRRVAAVSAATVRTAREVLITGAQRPARHRPRAGVRGGRRRAPGLRARRRSTSPTATR